MAETGGQVLLISEIESFWILNVDLISRNSITYEM